MGHTYYERAEFVEPDEQNNAEYLAQDDTDCNAQLSAKHQLMKDGMDRGAQIMKSVESIYANHQRTKQLKIVKDIELHRMAYKYKVCHEFLTSTFKERQGALEKHYQVLDDAISKGDRDLIILAMNGIGNIVTTSPLTELQRLAQVFDDTSVPLLDF